MLSNCTVHLIFSLILIAASPLPSIAQEPFKARTAQCMAASSGSIDTQPNKFHIRQHIGHQGISGTVHANNHTLIQGFISPTLAKASPPIVQEPQIEVQRVPFAKSFIIHFPGESQGTATATVYNVNGQAIITRFINNSNTFEISFETQPPGYYFLMIRTNEKQYTTKLPIQK